MAFPIVAAGLTALVLLCILANRLTRPSLPKIRGPKSTSFLLGNLLALFKRPVGLTDFEWQSAYGDVVRFKTIFEGDQLLVADPKALQRMFSMTSSYLYPKQPNLRILSLMISGKGLLWAEGKDHKRQRRILLPGFSGQQSKAFLNVFKGCAESMCAKWTEVIEASADRKVVLNIPSWLFHATMAAISQAAFDLQYDTTQSDGHPLMKYNHMVSDVFGHPSSEQIFVQAASKYFPLRILQWMADHGSHPRLKRARETKEAAAEVAKGLVREKAEFLLAGQGRQDLLTLLVKANMDSDAKSKMSEEELISQMRTILLAGHETTSNTLEWLILEMARHPEIQSRLRAEIREREAAIRARGDTEFMTADFENMPYTMAVIKEGLRYHPVVAHVQRIASCDDILPLSRPVTTESGEVIDEIFVPKGTRIVVSIAAYNRNKDLWGEDAHEFNPDRWLEGTASAKKPVSVGVLSNLMTFIGGARSCIGWRFAIVEIQAFLVEIFGKFEIAMTERSERICRAPGPVMSPMIEGELERGPQLPLVVSIAPREDDV